MQSAAVTCRFLHEFSLVNVPSFVKQAEDVVVSFIRKVTGCKKVQLDPYTICWFFPEGLGLWEYEVGAFLDKLFECVNVEQPALCQAQFQNGLSLVVTSAGKAAIPCLVSVMVLRTHVHPWCGADNIRAAKTATTLQV